MGQRSTITQLPTEIRSALDERLVKGAFTDYAGLADWLSENGYSLSKSALHRYGQQFQAKIDAIRKSTELARALREHVGDDAGEMSDATLRLGQHLLFELMQKIDPAQVEDIDLPKLMRALADLSRASVSQKKWQQEFEAAVAARTKEAAEAVEHVAKTAGVSAEGIDFMRRKILGIPAHA